MSLHVPLSAAYGDRNFAATFNSGHFSTDRFGNELGVINKEAFTLFELAEELVARGVYDGREHPHLLYGGSRLNRNVSAAIGAHKVVAIAVFGGTVNYDLGPPVRVHRPEGYLEGQVPDHPGSIFVTRFSLEGVLALSRLIASCDGPVRARHKVIFDRKAV